MKQYTESLIEEYITDEVNTEDFIAYTELEKYFNKYYFNSDGKSLLPPAGDKEGWNTLHNLANIEQGIYKGDKTASGLARICIFYNNYVIEHWLLANNVFKFETRFIPDEKYKDNDDYTALPSHEYLRRCDGESIPDFEYIDQSGNKVTLDVKTLKASERKPDVNIINTPAHNAKYVAGYNPINNTLILYKQLKGDLYLKYPGKEPVELNKINPSLPSKLIPWKMIMADNGLYFDWNRVFAFEDQGEETVNADISNSLTEQIDQVAAKQFMDNLTNNQVIDTDAFHKAYDSELQTENLMNLFDSQTGKLKHKGTYGDIKNCVNPNLKKALVQFWVAQFKDFRNTVNETKASTQKKEEIEELAEFILYNAINKLTKSEPQLVKEYLELSGLDGIDDAFTIEVNGNNNYFIATIRLKGCDVIVTLKEDDLNAAEQDINVVLGGVGRFSGIEGQLESAVTKLRTEKYTKKIQDTLDKLGLQDYYGKNDSVYFLDPQTEDIIVTCWKQDPNNYSKDNLIACKVKSGQPLHNNQDIPYNNLPDLDKLKVVAVSTTSASSGRSWGTSDEIITYDPTIDDKLKRVLGVHGKDSSEYAGSGNGQSVAVQNNVPDNLAKLGLTVREDHHSEYDSSD